MLPVAVRVNGDWGYTPVGASEDICSDVCSRLRLVRSEEARVKLHLGKLGDILNPQPHVAAVVHTPLLHWIYSAGEASQRQAETPPLPRPDGTPIFPPYEKYWWLTDLDHRKPAEILANPENDLIDDENFRAGANHAGCGSSDSASTASLDSIAERDAQRPPRVQTINGALALLAATASHDGAHKLAALRAAVLSRLWRLSLDKVANLPADVRLALKRNDPSVQTGAGDNVNSSEVL